jgi:hypothetical protein
MAFAANWDWVAVHINSREIEVQQFELFVPIKNPDPRSRVQIPRNIYQNFFNLFEPLLCQF